jgi:MoaA/NifB/PqqE/SkfB family radical SAM enzyme
MNKILTKISFAFSKKTKMPCKITLNNEITVNLLKLQKKSCGSFLIIKKNKILAEIDSENEISALKLPANELEIIKRTFWSLNNTVIFKITVADFTFKLQLFPKTSAQLNYYDSTPYFYLNLINLKPELLQHEEVLLKTIIKFIKKFDAALEQEIKKINDHKPSLIMKNNVMTEGTTVKKTECRLFLTLKCNQNCLFCCAKDSNTHFKFPEIKKALLKLKERSPKNIVLAITGGEPTIHPDFFKILGLIRSLKLPTLTLQTNGIMLARKKNVIQLYKIGINTIIFSFHSHLKKTYNLLTQTSGQYEKALTAINNITHYPFDQIVFNMVINKYNYKDILNYVKFISKLKTPSKISFMPSIVNMEKNNGNWQKLAVKHSLIIPELVKAINFNPKLFSEFKGDCYFPICIGKNYPEILQFAPSARISENTLYLNKKEADKAPENTRIKAKNCKKCKYDLYCGGICSSYARSFGLAELTTIKR